MQAMKAQFTGEGSTRRVAVLRIGVALLVWTRFANEFALWHDRGWAWGLTGASVLLSSTALLIGLRSRLAALWTGASVAFAVIYIGVVQRHHGLIHHHVSLLMIITFLLAATPCGRSLSVDRWRALRRGDAPPEMGSLWGTWLIALQVSAVWLWGAIDKLKVGWLSGERMEAITMSLYWGSDRPDWPGFSALMVAAAVGTVVIEFAFAFGMFVPRWQRRLIPAAVLFHGVIYFTLPVSTFTATMLLGTLAFVPADRVHAAIDRLLAGPGPHTMPP